MHAVDVCIQRNELVMGLLQMECQIKNLRVSINRLQLVEPILGTEEHTTWHAELCDLQDTLHAVESTLGLARRAQKRSA
jgi:hypothetical protein